MRSLWLCLLLTTACSAASTDRLAPRREVPSRPSSLPPLREEIVPGRALVEVEADTAPLWQNQVQAQAAPWSLGGVPVRLVRPIFTEEDGGRPLLLLEIDAATEESTRQAIGKIAKDPRVHRAEPDRIRRPAAIPNDPQYRVQWNLQQVQLPRAWDRSVGAESVTVAILDTGILKEHPDLKGRLVDGYDFIADMANAGDGNGRDADPTDSGSTEPGSSGLHGTHVAGVIGAETGNGRGIAGVDWRCKLMPVRVLGVNRGTGVDSDIADALRWAAGIKVGTIPPASRVADVINMSFGGLGISFTVQRAVDQAVAQGAIVVAAAGNGSVDAGSYSPGGLDGVITVGASTKTNRRAGYSNHGPRVDLMAPGGDEFDIPDGGLGPGGILSTYRDVGEPEGMGPFSYFSLEGTSQAAPHVAGAAALVRSMVKVQQLTMATLLRASAEHKYRCDQEEEGGCGAGLLNVENLLVAASFQTQCSCKGDRYCFDGKCIDPGYPHISIFADPVVRGGCQMAPSSQRFPGLPAACLSLGLGWLLLRRKRSPTPKST